MRQRSMPASLVGFALTIVAIVSAVARTTAALIMRSISFFSDGERQEGRKWRGAFALLFFLIASSATNLRPAYAQQPQARGSNLRVALIIANSAYQDVDTKLANLPGDARALGDELRRDGFAVTVRENLGKDNMRRALEAFQSTIAPNSAALFYFSGFGIQVDRHDYLISIDARIWAERSKGMGSPSKGSSGKCMRKGQDRCS